VIRRHPFERPPFVFDDNGFAFGLDTSRLFVDDVVGVELLHAFDELPFLQAFDHTLGHIEQCFTHGDLLSLDGKSGRCATGMPRAAFD
jgi:hypothetical protein